MSFKEYKNILIIHPNLYKNKLNKIFNEVKIKDVTWCLFLFLYIMFSFFCLLPLGFPSLMYQICLKKLNKHNIWSFLGIITTNTNNTLIDDDIDCAAGLSIFEGLTAYHIYSLSSFLLSSLIAFALKKSLTWARASAKLRLLVVSMVDWWWWLVHDVDFVVKVTIVALRPGTLVSAFRRVLGNATIKNLPLWRPSSPLSRTFLPVSPLRSLPLSLTSLLLKSFFSPSTRPKPYPIEANPYSSLSLISPNSPSTMPPQLLSSASLLFRRSLDDQSLNFVDFPVGWADQDFSCMTEFNETEINRLESNEIEEFMEETGKLEIQKKESPKGIGGLYKPMLTIPLPWVQWQSTTPFSIVAKDTYHHWWWHQLIQFRITILYLNSLFILNIKIKIPFQI